MLAEYNCHNKEVNCCYSHFTHIITHILLTTLAITVCSVHTHNNIKYLYTQLIVLVSRPQDEIETLNQLMSNSVNSASDFMNAATIVCVRRSVPSRSRGGFEVLLGQNECQNWLRSTPEKSMRMHSCMYSIHFTTSKYYALVCCSS